METQDKQRMSKVLGITIPQARCRNHLDKLHLNKDISLKIDELKKQKEAGADAAEVDAKLEVLKSQKIRFSAKAHITTAAILDRVITNLLLFAMGDAIKHKAKIVKPENLHGEGAKEVELFRLFGSLPSYLKLDADLSKKSQEALVKKSAHATLAPFHRGLNNLLAKVQQLTAAEVEKSVRDAAAPLLKDVKKLQEKSVVEEPKQPAEEEEVATESESDFAHYVNGLKSQIVSAEHQGLRLSKKFRDYVSELTTEFLAKLAKMLQVDILTMSLKTVSDSIVLHAVQLMLIDDLTFATSTESSERTVVATGSGFEKLKEEVSKKLKLYEDEVKPKVEEAKVEPKVEQPKVEEPKVEPKVEQPKAKAPRKNTKQ